MAVGEEIVQLRMKRDHTREILLRALITTQKVLFDSL